MKILAIDTSSKICSVSILDNEKVLIQLQNDDEKTHSIKLMPMVDEALTKSSLSLDNINLLACSIGPGSFTGVRIGIATVKSFADAKNIPTIGISSLEGLAYNIICSAPNPMHLSQDSVICSMIDAKNNQVYCGCYQLKENRLYLVGELMADDISVIMEKINTFSSFTHFYFIGDGALMHQDFISQNLVQKSSSTFLAPSYSLANSCSIARLAYLYYQDGSFATSLSPLYLRKSQAERMLEEKEKKNT